MAHRLQVADWALQGALDAVGDDPAPAVERFAAVMLAKREIALAGLEVCDLAMEVAGGSAFFKGSVIERCYRDIRAIKFHPITPEETLVHAGRLALGSARRRAVAMVELPIGLVPNGPGADAAVLGRRHLATTPTYKEHSCDVQPLAPTLHPDPGRHGCGGVPAPPKASQVTDGAVVRSWTSLAFAAVRNAKASDAASARLYAMVNTAMYDAVNGLESHPRWSVFVPPSTGNAGDPAVAAAAAAHGVLSALFPALQSTYDDQLARRPCRRAARPVSPSTARSGASTWPPSCWPPAPMTVPNQPKAAAPASGQASTAAPLPVCSTGISRRSPSTTRPRTPPRNRRRWTATSTPSPSTT